MTSAEIILHAVEAIGFAGQSFLMFCGTCYIVLPVYVMWRLGKSERNNHRRHEQLIHELRCNRLNK